jgi:glycosyltransferase involved in cell wall biosynthesis
MKSILILLHCQSNTGYAIGPLEAAFFRMAMTLCDNDATRVHFAYPSMERGPTDTLPADFRQYVVLDAATSDPAACERARDYIAQHHIDTIFGFDQPVTRPIYKYFRQAGVKHFIAYWGQAMSSIFGPVKRTLKRVEVALRRHGPDHYIFESQGMRDAAVLGRGVPLRKTTLVRLGVDTERYRPPPDEAGYVYAQMNIPAQCRIFFYSGHMSPVKGVDVIMRAVNQLAESRADTAWRVVLCGNRAGEEQPHLALLTEQGRAHAAFGGYRSDLNLMHRGCYAAIIASTGPDSFALSGVEMQASGLPLLASQMTGLQESVVPGQTGFHFPPGDFGALATLMSRLLDDRALRDRLSLQARARVEREFSLAVQQNNLVKVVRQVTGE